MRSPCHGEGSYAATWQVTVHRYDQFPLFYPESHMLIKQIEQYRQYTTKAYIIPSPQTKWFSVGLPDLHQAINIKVWELS
jgi:hypothetical protein